MNWVIELGENCLCVWVAGERAKQKEKEKYKRRYKQTDMLRKENLLYFWRILRHILLGYQENLLILEYFACLLFHRILFIVSSF
jgi:hypothetical protein